MVNAKCVSKVGTNECGGQLGFLGYNILYNQRGEEVISNSYKCMRCSAVLGIPTEYHLCKKRGIIYEAKIMGKSVELTCDTCPLAPPASFAGTTTMPIPTYKRCIHYERLLQKSEVELDNPVRMKSTYGDHFLASKKIKLRRV
jgi:hypothetical protein